MHNNKNVYIAHPPLEDISFIFDSESTTEQQAEVVLRGLAASCEHRIHTAKQLREARIQEQEEAARKRRAAAEAVLRKEEDRRKRQEQLLAESQEVYNRQEYQDETPDSDKIQPGQQRLDASFYCPSQNMEGSVDESPPKPQVLFPAPSPKKQETTVGSPLKTTETPAGTSKQTSSLSQDKRVRWEDDDTTEPRNPNEYYLDEPSPQSDKESTTYYYDDEDVVGKQNDSDDDDIDHAYVEDSRLTGNNSNHKRSKSYAKSLQTEKDRSKTTGTHTDISERNYDIQCHGASSKTRINKGKDREEAFTNQRMGRQEKNYSRRRSSSTSRSISHSNDTQPPPYTRYSETLKGTSRDPRLRKKLKSDSVADNQRKRNELVDLTTDSPEKKRPTNKNNSGDNSRMLDKKKFGTSKMVSQSTSTGKTSKHKSSKGAFRKTRSKELNKDKQHQTQMQKAPIKSTNRSSTSTLTTTTKLESSEKDVASVLKVTKNNDKSKSEEPKVSKRPSKSTTKDKDTKSSNQKRSTSNKLTEQPTVSDTKVRSKSDTSKYRSRSSSKAVVVTEKKRNRKPIDTEKTSRDLSKLSAKYGMQSKTDITKRIKSVVVHQTKDPQRAGMGKEAPRSQKTKKDAMETGTDKKDLPKKKIQKEKDSRSQKRKIPLTSDTVEPHEDSKPTKKPRQSAGEYDSAALSRSKDLEKTKHISKRSLSGNNDAVPTSTKSDGASTRTTQNSIVSKKRSSSSILSQPPGVPSTEKTLKVARRRKKKETTTKTKSLVDSFSEDPYDFSF